MSSSDHDMKDIKPAKDEPPQANAFLSVLGKRPAGTVADNPSATKVVKDENGMAGAGSSAREARAREVQRLADGMHKLDRLPTSDEIAATRDAFELRTNIPLLDRTKFARCITGVIVVVNDYEWRVAKMFLKCEFAYSLPNFSGQTCYFAKFRSIVNNHWLLLVRLLNTAGGGSTGPNGSQALVDAILAQFSPRFVVGIGCAGGWDEKTHKKADVLISSVTAPYSFRKGNENRNLVHHIATDLLNVLRNPRESWRLEKSPATDEIDAALAKIHFGVILSGDKLVVTPEDKQDMLELLTSGEDKIDNQKIVGAEMEGTGIAAACARVKVPNAIIKGPSDFCVGKSEQTPAEKEEAQVRASFSAFHFFRHAFSYALVGDVLPPHWVPALPLTDSKDAVTAPIEIAEGSPGFDNLAKLVKHVRDGNADLKAKRQVPPTDADYNEYKALQAQVKKLTAQKNAAYQKIKPFELSKQWHKDRDELTAEATHGWASQFSSSVVKLTVDDRPYTVQLNSKIGDVKWSAREVEKYVSADTFVKMLSDLRGESKETVVVTDLVTKKALPEKASPKSRKKKGSAAPATAAAVDDSSEIEDEDD